MRIKANLKRVGRFFISLKQKSEHEISQRVLLVDGSFILPNNFALIIKGIKEKFKNAVITVLTFKDKEEFIRDNFPDIEIIVPEDKIKIKRYQLAIQFLSLLLRRKFNFIILSSLDISVVSLALVLARCPVFLHNRWLQWYRIRQRTISDILLGVRSADSYRRRAKKGIKGLVKNIGRIFAILTNIDEEDTRYPVLIVDNGYTDIGHVSTAVRRAEKIFVNPEITILTFAQRKRYFVDMFPQLKVISVKEPYNRYSLTIKMYQLRKFGFARIVLTTLDISPIVVSLLFMRTKVLLYNQWHQWWSLSFRSLWGYVKGVLNFLIIIPVSIYLLIRSGFILFRTAMRLKLINFNYSQGKNR